MLDFSETSNNKEKSAGLSKRMPVAEQSATTYQQPASIRYNWEHGVIEVNARTAVLPLK